LKNQDSFIKKVRENGFKPSAFKIYYHEQNTNNDYAMILSQQQNQKLFEKHLLSGTPEDLEKIRFYL